MKPLDRLRDELLTLEQYLAAAGVALLEAEDKETPEDVKMVLDAFGFRYKLLRQFLKDHGETARAMQGRHLA